MSLENHLTSSFWIDVEHGNHVHTPAFLGTFARLICIEFAMLHFILFFYPTAACQLGGILL